MSDTVWLQVNRGRGPEGGEQDNSIMVSLERELDALADSLGVARLSAFRDYSALEEHWVGYLLDELSYCADQLKAAAGQGHQFRFLIVP